MVAQSIDRRRVLGALGALGALGVAPSAAFSKDFVDLNWTDLIPEGQPKIPPGFQSMIQHDVPAMSVQQPPSQGVRTDWNGEIVRLPGYIVPIDHSSNWCDGVYSGAICGRMRACTTPSRQSAGFCHNRKAI